MFILTNCLGSLSKLYLVQLEYAMRRQEWEANEREDLNVNHKLRRVHQR